MIFFVKLFQEAVHSKEGFTVSYTRHVYNNTILELQNLYFETCLHGYNFETNGFVNFAVSEWATPGTCILQPFTNSAASGYLGNTVTVSCSGSRLTTFMVKHPNIAGHLIFIELVPFVLAFKVRGLCLQNKKVIFYVDNISILQWI